MISRETISDVGRLFDVLDRLERRFSDAFTLASCSRQGERFVDFKNDAGAPLLYVGIRQDLWMRTGSPLWYGVRIDWGPAAVARFSTINAGNHISFEGFVLCAVAKNAEADEIEQVIAEQLQRCADAET